MGYGGSKTIPTFSLFKIRSIYHGTKPKFSSTTSPMPKIMDTYPRLMPKKKKIFRQTPSNGSLDNLTFKNNKRGKQLSQSFRKT